MGWVETALTLGGLCRTRECGGLRMKLDTVGPEYEKRRTAAVIWIASIRPHRPLVRAKRYDGKPLDVEINPDLSKSDLYLRRLLPRWGSN